MLDANPIEEHQEIYRKKLFRILLESDKKIFHSNFIEVYHKFEDTRIQLVQHPEKLGIEGTIWKCRTYVDWAEELKEWTSKKYQSKLSEQFILLYKKSGISWSESIVSGADVNNMIVMYNSLLNFSINDENRKKLMKINKELQKILNNK